jgi:hypothetical protein
MRRLLNVFVFLATIALGACGSGGSAGGGIPAASSPASPLSAAGSLDSDEISAQTQALDPTIRPANLVNTNWLGMPPPSRPVAASGALDAAQAAASGTVSTQSYHLNDDGGQAGINLTPAAGSYVALTATHDVLTPGTGIQLPAPPANESDGNFLYAPTTKGANGACLEIGTSYYRLPGSSSTGAFVYFYDFCGGAGETVTVDGTFLAGYVTPATATRNAHYQIEILESTATSPPTWYGRLFDVKTKVWDTVYAAQGSFSGWNGRGWTMYETHYFTPDSTPVQCPQGLPTIGASSVRMTTAGGAGILFDGSNSSLYSPEPGETSFGAWGSCFNPTAGPNGSVEAASENFNLLTANSAWSVSSTGS